MALREAVLPIGVYFLGCTGCQFVTPRAHWSLLCDFCWTPVLASQKSNIWNIFEKTQKHSTSCLSLIWHENSDRKYCKS